MNDKQIGVVGGMGSYAAIDLIRKIYDATDASCDQEHLPVAMLSAPHLTVDRSQFLSGEIKVNPAISISTIINQLSDLGSTVVGIPCNTAHAPLILDEVMKSIPEHVQLIHLIEEVAKLMVEQYPSVTQVGVLGTVGTVNSQVYTQVMNRYGLNVIQPPEDIQSLFVSPAIYDKNYGIKSHSSPVQVRARNDLLLASRFLSRKGAQAIILGCTEIPLAITEEQLETSIVIDATKVLAQAMVRAANRSPVIHSLAAGGIA